jgi:hypothetical protein
MRLTDFETGLKVAIEFKTVQAWKLDGNSTWMRLDDGRIVHVRESMAEIDAKLSGKKVANGVS